MRKKKGFSVKGGEAGDWGGGGAKTSTIHRDTSGKVGKGRVRRAFYGTIHVFSKP